MTAPTVDALDVERLYVEHAPAIRRRLLRLVKNPSAADDLTQQTFLRLMLWAAGPGRRWEDRGRPVEAMLNTIARNLAADWYKTAERRFTTPVGGWADDMPTPPALVDRDVAETVVDADRDTRRAAAVRAAMARLTPHQRRMIELRYFRGLSVVDVAAALGVDVGAVKAATCRARIQMRRFPELRDYAAA